MSITTVRGTQLLLKFETSQGSGVFTHPCLVNTKRGIKFVSSTKKEILPDCDNPDDPAWQEVFKDVLSASIDGAGKLDTAGVPTFYNMLRSGESVKVRVCIGTAFYWQSQWQLTNFEVTGDRAGTADCTIAAESTGDLGDVIIGVG